jgi:hypothetical protein
MDGVELGLVRLKAGFLEPIHMDGCKLTPSIRGLDVPGEECIAELREFWSRRVSLRAIPLDC